MTPVLGLIKEAENAFAEFVHNCLLVAGGFLFGYILGMGLAWAVGRYVFRQRDNTIIKKVGGPIGGFLLALIVALLVFTGKGKGPGSGGDGKGDPNADPSGKSATAEPDPKVDPKLPPLKPIDPKPADSRVDVTILGGAAVQGERFYLVGEDRTPRKLDELAAALKPLTEKGKVVLVLRSPAKDYLDPQHGAVRQLARWAHDQGLDVIFPANR